MKKILIALAAVFYFASAQSYAQSSFDKEKIDKYFDELGANNKAMLSASILNDGKIVYSKSIGYSSVAENKKNNNLTKFRIGSITKMFTSSMIFQLIEEGKIKLDSKLSEFYSSVPNADKITISEMLYHRSGIYNFTNNENYFNYNTSQKTKKEMVDIISSFQPAFEPGSQTEYSNSNYVLLGYIIEDITGLSYKENLKERIADKIDLYNTYYGGKISLENNEAYSYTYSGGWKLEPETNMFIPGGAGAIVSTSDDLVKFIYSLFAGKIISKESLGEMTYIKNKFGRGIIQFPFYEKKILGHNGGIDGFVSNLGFITEDKVAFAVVSNGMNYSLNDILIGMLSIYFAKPFEIPDMLEKEIELDAGELNKYVGVFKSDALPLEITIKFENGQLFGQATGQNAFPLTPYSKTEFRFEQAGIVMEFAGENGEVEYKKFTLKQGGGNFLFERE